MPLRSRGALLALLAAAACCAAGLTLIPRGARAAGPTTLACGTAALQSALSAGGSYAYAGDCTITSVPATLTSSQVTTIDAAGHAVQIYANEPSDRTTWHRMVDVTAGALTMTGVQLMGGRVSAAVGTAGAAGSGGTAGATATSGTVNGGNGTAGGDAHAGAAAPPARGAAFYVYGGAALTLNGGAVGAAQASAQAGGAGGAGGGGGGGGSSDYGAGGNGGAAGDGASGGTGGAAQGGAIYVAAGASLDLNAGVAFSNDYAYSGAGGAGGDAGIGGGGGYGTGHRGGDAAPSGRPGDGGTGGAAQGGAIYSAGTLTITQATFSDARADAGAAYGGNGGRGGYGSGGGSGYSGGASGAGTTPGPGGHGGTGGEARGGAIYNAGTMTVAHTSFGAGRAYSGGGGSGGTGGIGPSGSVPNADGGPGGDGGTAEYASIASGSAVDGCATFTGGTVTAGAAGPGGYGGYTGNAPQGATGASGHAGTTGATDPTVANTTGVNCGAPTVSVLDQTAVEPAGHDGTMPVTVTLSAAQSTTVTVHYATADGTALAGRDYEAASGTLTFAPGQATATIPVTLHDTGFGPTRAFVVNLSAPSSNATIGRAQASGTIRGRGPIKVTVAWERTDGQPLVLDEPGKAPQPDTLRLADDDAGEVPQDAVVQLKLTNQGDATQTDISLNGVPGFSYHNPADARQTLPIGLTGKQSPETIEPLAGGASTTVTYRVHAINNGVFDLSPQVLSSAEGTGDTEVSNGLGTITVLPTAYLWLSVRRGSTGTVQAGLDETLVGTVSNRSLTQSIDVAPLEPTDSGNAGGGALHYVGTGPLADGVQLPFVGTMAPGQRLDVTGSVATGFTIGTRGEVRYDPHAAVLEADGSETALSGGQIGMATGTSPLDIPVDTRDPAVPLVTGDSLRDAIADGVFKTASQWSYNHFTGALELLRHPIQAGVNAAAGVADFSIAATKDVANAANLLGALYVLKIGYESMTPDQREAFAQSIVDDYQASHLGGDVGKMKASAEAALTTFEIALQTGDYNKVAEYLYGGLTTGYTGAADALLADVTMQKLATGLKVGAGKVAAGLTDGDGAIARAIVLKDAIRDAGVTAVLGKGIKGVEPGLNLLLKKAQVLTNDFGLTSKQVTELVNYCKREKLIIAVRSRATTAAELIQKGEAVGKNEVIKIKAVNSWDRDYLGYSKHDMNKVIWAEPIPEARMEASIAKLPAEEKAIVRERWKIRNSEWHDEDIRAILRKAQEEREINWGFDGVGNGAKVKRDAIRRFELKDQPSPYKGVKDRKYQQVLVGNKPGTTKHIRLVPVTQDVDVMAILKSDGSILDSKERAAAYIHLWDILDIQHGETPTWIMDGEIMFKKKAKQLADVVSGGEPLAVFNPKGGVTAGFFDPALTIFDNQTKGGRIFFKGGYNDPLSKWTGQLKLSARDLAKTVKGK